MLLPLHSRSSVSVSFEPLKKPIQSIFPSAGWLSAGDPSIPTTTMSRIDFQWKAAQQWLRLLVFLLTVFDKFLWSLNASNWIVLITTTSGISLPKLIVLCLGEYNNYKINDQICSHLHPPSCNTTNKNYATLHVWRLHTIWFHSNISPSSIYLCLSILKYPNLMEHSQTSLIYMRFYGPAKRSFYMPLFCFKGQTRRYVMNLTLSEVGIVPIRLFVINYCERSAFKC